MLFVKNSGTGDLNALSKVEKKKVETDMVTKIDEAILFDDPKMLMEVGLTKDQIVNFVYKVSGPRS